MIQGKVLRESGLDGKALTSSRVSLVRRFGDDHGASIVHRMDYDSPVKFMNYTIVIRERIKKIHISCNGSMPRSDVRHNQSIHLDPASLLSDHNDRGQLEPTNLAVGTTASAQSTMEQRTSIHVWLLQSTCSQIHITAIEGSKCL